MPDRASPPRSITPSPADRRHATWKLQDAKTRFSEVVRRARSDGPQRVTVRGHDAVVVIAAEELARLMPAPASRQTLVDFLQSLGISDLDVTRDRDTGRDIPL